MRLHAVHSESGEILAAVLVAPTDTVWPTPVPPEGAFSAEIEIPGQLADMDLYDLCTKFVIDARGEQPTLVPASDAVTE